jgi:hypothetical protein
MLRPARVLCVARRRHMRRAELTCDLPPALEMPGTIARTNMSTLWGSITWTSFRTFVRMFRCSYEYWIRSVLSGACETKTELRVFSSDYLVTTYFAPANSLCAALERCRNLGGHQSWCQGRWAHLAVSWNICQWMASCQQKSRSHQARRSTWQHRTVQSSRGSASAGLRPLHPGRFASQSRGEQLKICRWKEWEWHDHAWTSILDGNFQILHDITSIWLYLHVWNIGQKAWTRTWGPLLKCAAEDC